METERVGDQQVFRRLSIHFTRQDQRKMDVLVDFLPLVPPAVVPDSVDETPGAEEHVIGPLQLIDHAALVAFLQEITEIKRDPARVGASCLEGSREEDLRALLQIDPNAVEVTVP